jgi:hypothetical protein
MRKARNNEEGRVFRLAVPQGGDLAGGEWTCEVETPGEEDSANPLHPKHLCFAAQAPRKGGYAPVTG